eukprot:1195371-Prorocentrum_minimum.AAC.2
MNALDPRDPPRVLRYPLAKTPSKSAASLLSAIFLDGERVPYGTAGWSAAAFEGQRWAHVCLLLDTVRSNVAIHLMATVNGDRGAVGAVGSALVWRRFPLEQEIVALAQGAHVSALDSLNRPPPPSPPLRASRTPPLPPPSPPPWPSLVPNRRLLQLTSSDAPTVNPTVNSTPPAPTTSPTAPAPTTLAPSTGAPSAAPTRAILLPAVRTSWREAVYDFPLSQDFLGSIPPGPFGDAVMVRGIDPTARNLRSVEIPNR